MRPARRMAGVLGGLGLLALLLGGGWLAYQRWQAHWYEGQIPAEIQLEGLVEMGVQHGLTEGCGAVVFRLAEASAQSLGHEGLPALSHARQARAQSSAFYHYGPWRETPYIESGDGMSLTDRWLLGLNCAALSADLDAAIQAALSAKGAYYAKTQEGGLILIPARRLAVLSFDG